MYYSLQLVYINVTCRFILVYLENNDNLYTKRSFVHIMRQFIFLFFLLHFIK